MELRKLRHAVTLAHHLNFTKAADALNLTQSALSRSIQALEEECQLRLFDRNRNAVAITAAGKDFVSHAQGLLRKETELMEMVSHAAKGDGGNIALGMAPLAARTLLAPLMVEMIAKPGFHAAVTVGTPKKLLPMLMNEEIHIGVCTGRDMSSHALLASVPLATFPISMIVRSNHPLTRQSRVVPSDLERYPQLRTRPFDVEDDEPGTEYALPQTRPALVIEDYDVLMRITSTTDAIWITSPICARERISTGELTQIPIFWLPQTPHATMTAYYLKNRTLSPTSNYILGRIQSLSSEIFFNVK